MHRLSRQQLLLVIALTFFWGINWPVMKAAVTGYPPLSFRAASLVLGVPALALVLVVLKVPFRVPRAHWRELFWLTVFNMLFWHGLIIVAVKSLTSGRAAILGYTMPIFSAILGALFYGARLPARAWGGVAAAALGVTLLLWHEFANLGGRPLAVGMALVAAATWALGTQMLRHTRIPGPSLTISFWMTVATALFMLGLARGVEGPMPPMPDVTVAAMWFNAIMIFGFAHAAWFHLARTLPPIASSLSVMFIPVIGVFSGAYVLGEVLHWQDWAAVALMAMAIASVLWPTRTPTGTAAASETGDGAGPLRRP